MTTRIYLCYRSFYRPVISCASSWHSRAVYKKTSKNRTRSRRGDTDACQIRAKANLHWQRCKQLGSESCGHQWKDDEEFCERLIDNSCDLNTTINWEKEIGTTALHMKQESSSSELVELRTRPPSCLSYLSVPVLSCMRVMSTFLRLVLMEEVFLSPRKLLKLSAVACLRSLFLFARGAFLMILLVYVFVCLSSFGAELRFCMSWRSVSVCSSVVIALSWGCSFCVVDALTVIVSSSLLLRSASVAWLVVELGLFVLKACSWCAW